MDLTVSHFICPLKKTRMYLTALLSLDFSLSGLIDALRAVSQCDICFSSFTSGTRGVIYNI